MHAESDSGSQFRRMALEQLLFTGSAQVSRYLGAAYLKKTTTLNGYMIKMTLNFIGDNLYVIWLTNI